LESPLGFFDRAHGVNLTKLFPMTSLREIELRPGEEAMIQSARIRGVLAPVITPLKTDLSRLMTNASSRKSGFDIFSPFISDVS